MFVTLLCFIADNDVQAYDNIELAGDVLVVALPIAATALTLGFKDKQGTLEFAESAVIAMSTTVALKFTVDKTRPNGDNHSFPSGHASMTFVSAEFVRKRYGWELGVPAYALAMFVAYSRVEAGRHYTTDAIGGAAIGIVSSYLFTQQYKGWNIQPEAGDSYLGIHISRRW